MDELDTGPPPDVESETQESLVGEFKLNVSDFLREPVRYANLPYVTYDGHSYHLTFFAWTQPPGDVPQGEDNPVQIVTRLALPYQTVMGLVQQLQAVGIPVTSNPADPEKTHGA